LKNVVLAGWSMGGPVILSYYHQHALNSYLKALVLIDTAPFPFGPAEWNSHALKNYNTAGMQTMMKTYSADPLKYALTFTGNMFKETKVSEADLTWIPAELTKTPAWIALAIYSDFLISDYVKVLPFIKIPTLVCAANSAVFKKGIEMGKAMAAQIPRAAFVPFEDAGHLLFYEQPEKFNKVLVDFIQGLK
jgi:pimeloyl-ACP methyl ester carboxylesterase